MGTCVILLVVSYWWLVFLYKPGKFAGVGHFPYHGDDVDELSDEAHFG